MSEPDLDQITLDQVVNMPGDQLLRLVANEAREEADDDYDRAIVAVLDVAARAYRTDDPVEHRAVTYAVAEMARSGVRGAAAVNRTTGGTA